MNNLKTLSCSFLFIVFSCVMMNAQHNIKTSNVDLITTNKNGNHTFYKKIDSARYQEVYFELHNYLDDPSLKEEISDDELVVREVFDDTITIEEIRESHQFIIKADEVTPTTDDFWKETAWENIYTKQSGNRRELFRFINKGFAISHDIVFKKKENTSHKNDTNWAIQNSRLSYLIYLEVREHKQIILFADMQDVYYAFVPFNGTVMPLESKERIASFSKADSKAYHLNPKEEYNYSHFSDYYRIHQNEDQSYELRTRIGHKVLPESYDDIYLSYTSIVTKKHKHFTVYNILGEKKSTGAVYSFYFRDNALELLTEKGAFFYNVYGNHPENIPTQKVSMCGSAQGIHYKIDSKTKNQLYIKQGVHRELDKTQKVIFRNLSKDDEISFLNNKNEIAWYGNELFDKKYIISLLKIKKGDSYGIRSYQYEFPNSTEEVDTVSIRSIPQLLYKSPKYLEAKIELPTQFDSIVMEKNGLIRFYKNSKVGIFPTHKTVQYDSLEKVTDHFYSIRRKRKTGWLNINTMEEFFF